MRRPNLHSVQGLLASSTLTAASLFASALFFQACAARAHRPSELARAAPRPTSAVASEAPADPTAHGQELPAEPIPDPIAQGLELPVQGITRGALADSFLDPRSGHRHEAIDIMAPRDTPVIAASEGRISRLSNTRGGGLSVYQVDESRGYCYFYAHLDGYAPGLREGQRVARGEPIGRVGTTGNAPRHAPHLHFAISRVDGASSCPGGTPINPYPILAAGARAESPVAETGTSGAATPLRHQP